jgi:predicted methyltransferase
MVDAENPQMSHRALSVAAALMAAAWLATACQSVPSPEVAIVRAVADSARTPDDQRRDSRDKPVQVLAFFGAEPGMRVLDLNSATGYYTELLARVVGPQGHVIAHNHPGAVAMLGAEAMSQRYGSGRLPNVEPLLARHDALQLPPRSLDMVLMSMVYHDTYWYQKGVDWGPVDQQALLKSLYEALRPGGVIGVIDHVAIGGSNPGISVMALHRIDPRVVRHDFLGAGFVLEAQSGLLRNAADDHTRGVFDPLIQGHTDRFVMRFRKPLR